MDKLSPAKQPTSHSSVENGAVSTATTATTALPVLSTRPANPPAPLMPTSSGNAQQHGNFNALKKAVRAGDMELVKQLLKQQPGYLETADDNGKTLIFHAIAMRRPEMIALLFDQKAKLEHVDQNGFTPLCYAAQLGYVAEAEKLLECGANANFDSGDLGTPALIAARFNKPEVLDLLKKHNVNIDAELNKLAASREKIDGVKLVSALTEKILNEKPEKGIALWKAELNRNDIVDELAIAIQDMAFDLKMNSFSPEPAELTIMSAGILANSISWLEENKPYDNKGLTGETLNLRKMNAMAQAKALEQAGRDAEAPLQEYMNNVLKDMVLHSGTGKLNAIDFKRESKQTYGVSNEVSEMLVSCFNAVCKEMDTNPNDMSKMNADYPLYRRFQNAFAKKVADNTNPNNKHTPAKSEKDRAAEVSAMLLARQLAVVKNWCDKILK